MLRRLSRNPEIKKMSKMREPTKNEDSLIRLLIEKANRDYGMEIHLDNYLVQPMEDGGMGSLTIIPCQFKSVIKRDDGPMVAEIHSFDKDQVEVIISLFLDTQNTPYELDIWKVDFTPLISLSDILKKICE